MKRRPAPLGFRRLAGPESLESRNLMAQVELISSASDGTPSNAFAGNPSISADNRYVAFQSTATNLAGNSATQQIYVKDRQTEAVTLVSSAADSTAGNDASGNAKISRDGKFVVFESSASNLVSGDTNGKSDVFRKELATGNIVRVSTDSAGAEANGPSNSPSISKDGSIVAFLSNATNLTTGLSNAKSRVFLKNLADGKTTAISQPASGDANAASIQVNLSADGKYAAFASDASNLVAGDTNNSRDVFRYEVATGKIERASTKADGSQHVYSSYSPKISADGSKIAFVTEGSGIFGLQSLIGNHVGLKDISTGSVKPIDFDTNSTFVNNGFIGLSISDDAQFVAFSSASSGVLSPDRNGREDVFVRRVADGNLIRANITFDDREIAGGGVDPVISPNGDFVLYATADDPRTAVKLEAPPQRVFLTPRFVAPKVEFSATSQIYVAGENAVPLDLALNFSDPDRTAASRWTATVSLLSGAEATDRFSLSAGTIGGKALSINGNQISLDGNAIGTMSGGSGTTPLTLTLNASLTNAEMSGILRLVTFSSGSVSTAVRTLAVRFQVDDNENGIGIGSEKTLIVRPAAYSPLLVLSGKVNSVPGVGPVVLAPNAGFYYPGRTNLAGGSLTVTLANGALGDEIRVRTNPSQGIVNSGGAITVGGKLVGNATGASVSPFTVTFNANATQAAVQTVLRNITFFTTSTNVATRTASFQLDNGAGKISNAAVKTIDVYQTPAIVLGADAVYVKPLQTVYAIEFAELRIDSRSSVEKGVLAISIGTGGFGAKIAIRGFNYDYATQTIRTSGGRAIGKYLSGGPNDYGNPNNTAIAVQLLPGTTTADVEALLRGLVVYTFSVPARYEIEINFSDSNYALSNATKLAVVVNRV